MSSFMRLRTIAWLLILALAAAALVTVLDFGHTHAAHVMSIAATGTVPDAHECPPGCP